MKKTKLDEDSQTEDNDLYFLTNLLLDIHKKYYSEDIKDVRDILQERKNIFKSKKFFVDKSDIVFDKLIEIYGGILVKCPKHCDIYLKSNKHKLGPYKGGIPILHTGFVYDSIYKLELLPIRDYMLGSLKEEIKSENESENESVNDSIESFINDIEENLQ